MKPEYAQKYYRLEAAHPWSVGRRDVIRQLLDVEGVARTDRILEVGCGSGALVGDLVRDGYEHVIGVDLAQLAVDAAHAHGVTQVERMDGSATTFDDAAFDVIIASDVLEHIMDEQKALAEWRRLLRPGGLLLCFVPAFAFLWSDHDVENHHYRRYSRSMLESCVLEAGYDVSRIGYWNAWLFGPLTAMRMARRVLVRNERVERRDDFVELNPTLARMFRGAFKLENRFIRMGGDFPLGVSVYAVLRSP